MLLIDGKKKAQTETGTTKNLVPALYNAPYYEAGI
jgi:hypothetical protein